MPRNAFAVLVAVSGLAGSARLYAADPTHIPVFVSGAEGYHTFRIPSVIVTPKGTVLAFCEGRKKSRSDTGDIDLLLKRSTDSGKSWSPTTVVWNDADNVCGNPCPVVDAKTGTIWLLLTHNLGQDTEAKIVAGTSKGTRTVWVTHSTDDGVTWAQPTEITKSVKKAGWTWYATGPGVGIQLRSGRLLIPCDSMSEGGRVLESHVILSDDGGRSWRLGGIVGPGCNECQAIERSDGSVLLNMRSYLPGNRRQIAVSTDGGESFTKPIPDAALIEPVCQASILRLPDVARGVIFSNPASTKREKMTVRLSRDDGKTWPHAAILQAGPAAYSCLTVLRDGQIGCLYERGTKSPYDEVAFARFPQVWVTESHESRSFGRVSNRSSCQNSNLGIFFLIPLTQEVLIGSW